MNTALKRVVSMILAFTLFITLIPFGSISVLAESPMSGECGHYQYWNYDALTKTLTINCTDSSYNKMYDYTYGKEPWFDYRESIRFVNADSGVMSVGNDAFMNCTALEIVNMPGVTTIGDSAFEGCSALKRVILSSNYFRGSIGNYAFAYCNSLTKIVLPFNSIIIGEKAFLNCTNLKTLGIYCYAEIGNNAFQNCSRLSSIYMVNNGFPFGNKVSNNAFSGVNASVYYSDSYSYTPTDSFGGQFIYKKMTSGLIGYDAYWNYDQTNKLLTISGQGKLFEYRGGDTLPWMVQNNNRSYYSEAKTVIIKDGITEIPSYAFEYMGNVESVVLPNTLLRLYPNAFNDCKSLTEIVIPSSVEYVDGRWYWYRCPNLNDVYYVGTEEEWNTVYNLSTDNSYRITPHFLVYHPSTQSCTKAGYPAHYEFDGTTNHTYYDLNKIAITTPEPSMIEHVFSEDWNTDSNRHWHTCTVCGIAVSDDATHVYDNPCDDICNVCGYTRTVTHEFNSKWSKDSVSHWHECTICGNAVTDKSSHSFTNSCDTTCNICGYERTITHSFSDAWTSDSMNHWHTCAVCGAKADFEFHGWDDGVITVAATCTATGTKTFSCTVCSATKAEPIAATGHSYGAWTKLDDTQHQRICANDDSHIETADHAWNDGEITAAATCTVAGTKTFTCTVCSAIKTEPIAATGHSYGAWTNLDDTQHQRVCANDIAHVEKENHAWNNGELTTAPTCTTDGVKTFTCTVCTATKTEAVTSTGHSFGAWTKLDDTQHQRVCVNDNTHVEKANHTWDSGVIITAASCTKDGVKTFTCNVCKATKTEVVTSTGHSFGAWTKLDDTQHQRVCVNDNTHVEQENHVWDDGKITTSATCTEDGVKTYTCTVCNATKTEPIPATGHSFGEWKMLDETQHQRFCANDNTHVEQENHVWNGGEITTPATCTKDGIKTFTCTVCGETKTEEIPAKGHTEVVDTAVASTCTADGKTEGSHCSACGEVLTAQTVIKATGHQWDDGAITTTPTCTKAGVKTYTCIVCGNTKTEPIPVTSEHIYGEWTKLNDTQHQRVCANDFSHTETENHTFDDGVVKEQNGTYYLSCRCIVCGAEIRKEFDLISCVGTPFSITLSSAPENFIVSTEDGAAVHHLGTDFSGIWFYDELLAGKTSYKFSISDIGSHKLFFATESGFSKTYLIYICAHEWDNGVVTKEATSTTEGEIDFTCIFCGQTETRAIPKLKPTEPAPPTDATPIDATPTDATPTDAVRKLGDVDGDGKLTPSDARLALRASVGLEPDITPDTDAWLACDVDGDGAVTSADARLILRASVGLEDAGKFGKKA